MKMKDAICGLHRFTIYSGLLLMTVFSARADYKSTVLNDQPIAYYALDLTIDNSGTATDLSGNGNNSAYYNLTSTTGPSAFIPNAAFFPAGGYQSLVDLSSGTNTGILNFGGPITMEAWVQSTNTTQGPADIIGKGYDSSQSYNELVLRANSGGNYYGGTYNNTNGSGSASGGLQTTNWTYLVSTYDGTNWNLYVNGVLVGQSANSLGAINFSDPWAIGTGSADGFSRYFQGAICQAALYTNALTPAQVLAHYYVGEINSSPSNSAPIIALQPQPQSTFAGGTVTFSVGVVSAFPTTNLWFKNNVPMTGKTNATLTLSGVSAADAVNYSVVVGNGKGTTNSVQASLTLLAAGNSLQWSANGNSGVWDTGSSANWIDLSNNTQVVFNSNDRVLFDDTVGVPTAVTINGTVSPSVFTVNSSANSYNFSAGSSGGTISGAGSLIKGGTSTLTIVSPANFTGPVTINGGTIYAGNNCFHSVASVTITNNSTLDFGGGTYNSGQPVTVSGTGVNGLGALYNSYDDYPGEAFAITLAGDTTIGGLNRWDLTAGSTVTGPHKLTINWTDSADSYYGEWNTVSFATNVGDIELAAGNLGIKNMGSSLGNPASNFIVDSGCQLDFWTGDSGYARNFHVLGGGELQILANIGVFAGNITFENGSQFTSIYGSGNQVVGGAIVLNGNTHFVFGDANNIFTNIISGAGGFVWDAYNHEIILAAANTYTGPTVIGGGLTLALTNSGSILHSSTIFFGGSTPSNESLDASGRPDGTLTLASGQTLGGIGTVNGKLVVQSGATIAPAGTNVILTITAGSNVTGALSASNDVTLAGNTVMKLNGTGVSDEIMSSTKITFGGTLTLANVSGSPLAAGNSFQLFSAPGMSGSFNISPATPGAGLAWDTSQLASSGVLNVIVSSAGPVIQNVELQSGKLVFSGYGGTASANYVVYAETNLASTNWIPIMTNAFDSSGNFGVTNTLSPTTPVLFYRIK